MAKEADNVTPKAKEKEMPRTEAKLSYTTPELKEHGKVEEVTLQTFFGTFSPPS